MSNYPAVTPKSTVKPNTASHNRVSGQDTVEFDKTQIINENSHQKLIKNSSNVSE